MQDELHSEKLSAGQRTYFFDIKQTPNGDKYLNITESKLGKDGERERRDIRVFDDHIADFAEAFGRAAKELEPLESKEAPQPTE
jgi:hypothetical protein